MSTNKELTFRAFIAQMRSKTSLNEVEIQCYANTISKLWRDRNKSIYRQLNQVYNAFSRTSNTLKSVLSPYAEIEEVSQETKDTSSQVSPKTGDTSREVSPKIEDISPEVSREMKDTSPLITKEERITKENLPPTPPIREKNKKEETASPIGSAAARASVQARVREANVIPTWEMVLTRAKTTIGCNNIAWLREWFNEMNCANWCDGDGNPIHNWGRALGIAWRYKDVDAARRDPSRFQKPVDKELEEAERRKEQQKKLIQEQIAIVKAKYLAEQEAMNERR